MNKIDDIEIRKSTIADLPRLQEIFAAARRFMAATGNPSQWAESYPGEELLRSDIDSGDSYVCMRDGKVVGTFLLRGGEDPTYAVIYGGQWLNSRPYATLHRVASSGERKWLMHIIVTFAKSLYSDLRIDTHSDNAVMRRAVEREGFIYCGVIRCWNGTERVAYQYAAEA